MYRSRIWLISVLFAVVAMRLDAAIDDQDNTNPTAWRVFVGQTGSDIDAVVRQGFRIVDIRVEDAAGSRFTVTYVRNDGAYGTGWWYLINVDAVALAAFVSQNSARITSITGWDGGGSPRFAVALVPNTGAGARVWWWYHDIDAVTFYNNCVRNNARPIDLHRYRIGASTRVTGVMIANTGADAKPWWLYSGIGHNTLGTLLGQNQARLLHMQESAPDTLDVIMVRDNVGPWWYWFGASGQQVLDLAGQWGARPIDLHVNSSGSLTAVFLGISDSVGNRVGGMMRAASDGLVGAYLKRVNGPVLGYFNGDRIFEPASTIKTLIHYHGMDQVRQGAARLTENVMVYTGTQGSCPQYSGPVAQPLQNVLQSMMENSDNNRTLAAVDRFGQGNINGSATALGMVGTAINHRIGCGGPTPNMLSLADLGRLHESVANGSLGAQRATFYQLMLEFGDNYAGGRLNGVIDQEGASLGLATQQVAAFKARCRMAFKGGSYSINARDYLSWGAWFALPFWRLSQGVPAIVEQEYVTGSFVHGATNGVNAGNAFNLGAAEVLREEVRAALTTWRGRVVGSFATFGNGCAGSAGVPQLLGRTALPDPEPLIGHTVIWQLERARRSSPAVLFWGGSRDQYLGVPLPINLGYLGMPGCTLDVAPQVTFSLATDATGRAALAFTLPNNTFLLGRSSFQQCAVLDAGVNALGIVQSNALETNAGGLR